MKFLGIIFFTLLGGATWYFLCGLSEEDEKAEGKDKGTGCIVALILGLIGTLITFGFAALDSD